METGTDPTLLAMFSTLIVVMVGNIWHQSRENSKIRDLINGLRIEFDTKIGALEKRVDTKIGALDEKIDALDKKVDTKIGALEKRVDTKIGALDEKIDALDKKVDTKIGALEKRVDTKIGALDEKIDALDERVEGKVGPLTTEVAKLNGQFLEFKTATEKHLRMTDDSVAGLKVVVERSHTELKAAVSSNGERLARIEGHLGIGIAEPAPVT